MLRSSVLVALLALASVATVFAAHHEDCIHDDIQSHTKVEVLPVQKSTLSQRRMKVAQRLRMTQFGSTFGEYRSFFDTSFIDADPETTKWCATEGATFVDINGATQTCRAVDVMSETKKSFVKNTLVPYLITYIKEAFKVEQLTAALKPPASCSVIAATPASHAGGLGNIDFLAYISARPLAATSTTIAYAAFCQTHTDGRPTTAILNFNPSALDPNNPSVMKKVALHELFHAMGFSSSAFENYKDDSGTTRDPRATVAAQKGKVLVALTQITSPFVVAAAKEQFGCSTLTGLELEDGGGSGTAGSHWESRIMQNEVLVGNVVTSAGNDPPVSAMTLALFRDSGWYLPLMTKNETLPWGKNEGCDFVTGDCGSWNSPYKCTETKENMCSWTGRSTGVCTLATYTTDLELKYQHYTNPKQGGSDSLSDFCAWPVPYSNGDCTNAANFDATTSKARGYRFGGSSYCFTHANVCSSSFVCSAEATGGCFATSCGVDGTLYVALWQESGTDLQLKCPIEGGSVSVPATWGSGSITCPKASDICASNPTVNCVGAFSAWGTCEGECGGKTGNQTRTYAITQPALNGGAECTSTNGATESQTCTTAACTGTKVDCAGTWSDYTACTKTCGSGTRERTYTINTKRANGGSECEFADQTKQTVACGERTCEVCGDKITAEFEGCDDGNTVSGDGCSSTCLIESGFTCSSASNGTASTCSDAGSPTADFVLRLNRDAALPTNTLAADIKKTVAQITSEPESNVILRGFKPGSIIVNGAVASTSADAANLAVQKVPDHEK